MAYRRQGRSLLDAILAGIGLGMALAVVMMSIIRSFIPDFFF